MQSIFYPLEQLYKFLYLSVYDITGDYGIALILLSLFIYIILFPFNQKAQQIQNAEREVQSIIAPQIEEIKRRFHGKEQYEKIQRLYHRYAYHPIYAIRSAAGIERPLHRAQLKDVGKRDIESAVRHLQVALAGQCTVRHDGVPGQYREAARYRIAVLTKRTCRHRHQAHQTEQEE